LPRVFFAGRVATNFIERWIALERRIGDIPSRGSRIETRVP